MQTAALENLRHFVASTLVFRHHVPYSGSLRSNGVSRPNHLPNALAVLAGSLLPKGSSLMERPPPKLLSSDLAKAVLIQGRHRSPPKRQITGPRSLPLLVSLLLSGPQSQLLSPGLADVAYTLGDRTTNMLGEIKHTPSRPVLVLLTVSDFTRRI